MFYTYEPEETIDIPFEEVKEEKDSKLLVPLSDRVISKMNRLDKEGFFTNEIHFLDDKEAGFGLNINNLIGNDELESFISLYNMAFNNFIALRKGYNQLLTTKDYDHFLEFQMKNINYFEEFARMKNIELGKPYRSKGKVAINQIMKTLKTSMKSKFIKSKSEKDISNIVTSKLNSFELKLDSIRNKYDIWETDYFKEGFKYRNDLNSPLRTLRKYEKNLIKTHDEGFYKIIPAVNIIYKLDS